MLSFVLSNSRRRRAAVGEHVISTSANFVSCLSIDCGPIEKKRSQLLEQISASISCHQCVQCVPSRGKLRPVMEFIPVVPGITFFQSDVNCERSVFSSTFNHHHITDALIRI